jgi:hypothetical protein
MHVDYLPKFANYIASESVYALPNLLMHDCKCIIAGIQDAVSNDINKSKKSKLVFDDSGMELLNRLRYLFQQFNNIKLDFKPSEEMLDYCECGNVMQILAGSSEMVCDHCGYLYELRGTVFDDSQFFSQEGMRYKHAGY